MTKNAHDQREASISDLIKSEHVSEALLAFDRLPIDQQTEALANLDPKQAVEIVENVVDLRAVQVIEQLPIDVAASILDEATSDQRVDLLAELEPDVSESIIDRLSPGEADETRTLLKYDSDSAGGLMNTELVQFQTTQTVAEVINEFGLRSEQYRDYDVQYSFVCAEDELVGVLPLRDLVLSNRSSLISDVMIAEPLSVKTDTSLNELEDVFNNHQFIAVPVVDEHGNLKGIVRRLAVEQARSDTERSDYLKSHGIVGGEEIRSLPLLDRSKRRLSWLSVNIGLNILAASVIAMYQDTLQSVIALAVFLPIISDMSGCSGNQSVAVSMRELSLGLVKPPEILRVFRKEIAVGVLNGLVLGTLVALSALVWKGDALLGLVVGAALCLNTMVAVSIGGVVPLVIKAMGKDPAIASGPLLTTVTDMCGFFFVLGLASILLV